MPPSMQSLCAQKLWQEHSAFTAFCPKPKPGPNTDPNPNTAPNPNPITDPA